MKIKSISNKQYNLKIINNNYMLTLTKKTSLFLLIFFCNVFFSTLATGQNTTEWLNNNVSIRFQEEPMSSVLGKISTQTGIAILYDEKLADQKVTGNYKNILFSEAINRLFSETNKSIQVFKTEKKIIVKTFGAKQFVLASSNETAPDNLSRKKMTFAELQKMYRQQHKEYRKHIADETEVLEGGMTRGEVRAMQKKQYSEYQKNINNNDKIIEIVDKDGVKKSMTRGEIRAMQKKQYSEYQKNINNNRFDIINEDGIITGVTGEEVRAMQKRQRKAYKETLQNKDRVIEHDIL